MEKLELKHIAPYLPYKLKIYYELVNDRNQLDWELTCTNVDFLLMNQNKPILHPLSDLTKPCLPDDKIPLIELCDIERGQIYWTDGGNKSIIDCDDFKGQKVVQHDSYDSIMAFGFNTELKMFYGTIDIAVESQQTNIIKQIELFQKLFEWHFDVFGLIEKGLAVDINTLK